MKTIMLGDFDKRDEEYIFSLIKRELEEMGIRPTSAAFHIEVEYEEEVK